MCGTRNSSNAGHHQGRATDVELANPRGCNRRWAPQDARKRRGTRKSKGLQQTLGTIKGVWNLQIRGAQQTLGATRCAQQVWNSQIQGAQQTLGATRCAQKTWNSQIQGAQQTLGATRCAQKTWNSQIQGATAWETRNLRFLWIPGGPQRRGTCDSARKT